MSNPGASAVCRGGTRAPDFRRRGYNATHPMSDDAPAAATPARTFAVASPTAAGQPSLLRRGSIGKIVLEVALITLGVFLALWVDEWRESVEHRQLAQDALQRFRREFQMNREAVVAVRDKHVASLERIRAYLAADPSARTGMKYPFSATNPAFLEYTAWDLALATQALDYIEPDLGQSVAHVYAAQRQLDALTQDITLVMYSKGGDPDPLPFTRALAIYFGDCTLAEPRLIKTYDDVLARLDARLGPAK